MIATIKGMILNIQSPVMYKDKAQGYDRISVYQKNGNQLVSISGDNGHFNTLKEGQMAEIICKITMYTNDKGKQLQSVKAY